MRTYHIIDTSARDARAELKHYTLEQVVSCFEPDKSELPDEHREWEKIRDIASLEEFLATQACGMEMPFQFEPDEVKDFGQMERANGFFTAVK